MRKNIESMKTNLDKFVAKLEAKNHELMEKDDNLRKLNQELIKTEQAKEEFMSMVSHELKTPFSLNQIIEGIVKAPLSGLIFSNHR